MSAQSDLCQFCPNFVITSQLVAILQSRFILLYQVPSLLLLPFSPLPPISSCRSSGLAKSQMSTARPSHPSIQISLSVSHNMVGWINRGGYFYTSTPKSISSKILFGCFSFSESKYVWCASPGVGRRPIKARNWVGKWQSHQMIRDRSEKHF